MSCCITGNFGVCGEKEGENGFSCSRPRGHNGDHIACDQVERSLGLF